MAHATEDDLKDLKTLLESLRKLSQLKEKSFGCFYFKSKGILHFHTQHGRRYAHVSDGKKWHEINLAQKLTAKDQKKALDAILKILTFEN